MLSLTSTIFIMKENNNYKIYFSFKRAFALLIFETIIKIIKSNQVQI